MNTAATTHHFGHLTRRWLWRIFLGLCALGIFIAAGIVGALVTLIWIV